MGDTRDSVPAPLVAPRASQGAATGNEDGTVGELDRAAGAAYAAWANHKQGPDIYDRWEHAVTRAVLKSVAADPAVVERVARAIYERFITIGSYLHPAWADAPFATREFYLDAARAALAALAPNPQEATG